jgi:glycosyltransferase involved in cell wall biosynthesis
VIPRIVLVENTDIGLRSTYGPRMHVARDKAIAGEMKGKWRIVNPDDRSSLKPTEEINIAIHAQEAKRVKKTRIAWVQDNRTDWIGGAEFSARQVMTVGQRCGFHIEPVTPKEFSVDPLVNADLIVLNNLWHFSGEQLRAILVVLFERRVPYLKYEHDHRELTRPEFSRRLFEHSAANVFLSPVHRENHREVLGATGECIPLAIDVDAYRPVPMAARVPGTALVCNVRTIKTWDRLKKHIAEHPEIRFTVLASADVIRGKNVKTTPPVPPEKMPALYSAHEFLVHLPDAWCAGERVVLEAALCGCKIVANERVGHTSWGWDLTDTTTLRERLADAPYEFWRLVDGILAKRAAA